MLPTLPTQSVIRPCLTLFPKDTRVNRPLSIATVTIVIGACPLKIHFSHKDKISKMKIKSHHSPTSSCPRGYLFHSEGNPNSSFGLGILYNLDHTNCSKPSSHSRPTEKLDTRHPHTSQVWSHLWPSYLLFSLFALKLDHGGLHSDV